MLKTKSTLISSISLLITIVMMVTLCSVGFTVSATTGEEIEKWDGQIAEKFAGGTGAKNDPFIIENGGQLYKMVKEYSNHDVGTKPTTQTYFSITKDIDLNNKQWYVTGTTANYNASNYKNIGFCGIIYGNGHVIKNLYSNKSSSAVGLIPVATQGAEIHDLHLDGGNLPKAAWNTYTIGAFIGLARGAVYSKPIVIDGCSTKNFTIASRDASSAFVGYTYSQSITIRNCYAVNNTLSHTATSSCNSAAFLAYSGGNDYDNAIIIENSHCADIYPKPYLTTGWASKTTFTNVYTCNEAYDSSITGVTKLTADQMKGSAAKENMLGLAWDSVWYTTENGYPTLTAPAVVECNHENTTTTDANVVEPTYFTAGSKDVVCECGKTVETGVVINPVKDAPVTFDKAVLNPETNKLTVTWTYSKALNEDIKAAATKGLAVKFAFGEKVYTAPNTVLTKDGGSIVIEGINADRFNTTLKVNLEFTIGEYTTTALNEVAEYSVAVKDAEGADAYAGLMDAIANATEAVVAGVGVDSDDFTAGASKIDIKAGTAEIKFVAKQALIDTLLENGNKDKRTVKLVVTIGEESHELTLPKLMSSITVKISGLSFDQMYGSISANLVIDYAEETGKADITTKAVTFNFKEAVNESGDAVAAALKALLG